MTTTIVFSDVADGDLVSQNASYSTSRSGGTITADTAADNIRWGQTLAGGTYSAIQGFVSFTYSPDAGEAVTAAYVRVRAVGDATSTAVTRSLTWLEYDWGASLTSADWRTPAQVAALTTMATVTNAEDAGFGYLMAGSDALAERLAASGPLRLVCLSSRTVSGVAPSGEEYASFYSANESGTADDPALVFTSAPDSTLLRVAGAQVQLSDGTWAVLESDAEPSPTILLRHVDAAGSASTVATLPLDDPSSQYFRRGQAAQVFALAVDDVDNLFVVGPSMVDNTLAASAFFKGSGHSWSQRPTLTAALPSYTAGEVNNIAAAWHNTGGDGTVMAVVSHTAGQAPNTSGDIVYALLNCTSLIVGGGSLLRASGTARGVLVTNSAPADQWTNYVNEVGTGLDVAAAPDTTGRGCVASYRGTAQPGGRDTLSVWRYVLAAGGTSIADSDSYAAPGYATKDAAGKIRVVPIDSTTFAVVSVDSTAGVGPTVDVFQNFGTTGTFTSLGTVLLGGESITSLPAPSALAASGLWDAVLDLSGDRLWFYYFDQADDRRLMRTGVNLSTYLADRSEVEVSAAVGASGSTNHAIRAHRGATAGQQTLVAVANETSGGDHDTLYVVDAGNTAPSAPTLTARTNFDADGNATLAWTFNDPGDTQSAYQVQINTSSGVAEYDSTKTTSATASHTLTGGTLDNPGDWQWRVMTWDSSDEASPWSSFGTFSTADGATVTITDPSGDNPAGVITDDYLIGWSATGGQDDYRVVVRRTDTNGLLVDTGWVTSAATAYLVAGMLSDVQYRVQVTVRVSSVESNTASRLITPSYSTPVAPAVSATGIPGGGYVLVSVTNPAPTGDLPQVTYNDILRRPAGSAGAYDTIGRVQAGGEWRDYTAASGTSYEYVARGTAGVYFRDSAAATGSVALQGVWVHDPVDAQGTARNFQYGKAARGVGVQVTQQGQHYAGRTHPVFDFGEHQTDTWSVRLDVPHGADWTADLVALTGFAEDRRVLMVRDNRARVFSGVVAGYSEDDQDWGTQVSFTVTRAAG